MMWGTQLSSRSLTGLPDWQTATAVQVDSLSSYHGHFNLLCRPGLPQQSTLGQKYYIDPCWADTMDPINSRHHPPTFSQESTWWRVGSTLTHQHQHRIYFTYNYYYDTTYTRHVLYILTLLTTCKYLLKWASWILPVATMSVGLYSGVYRSGLLLLLDISTMFWIFVGHTTPHHTNLTASELKIRTLSLWGPDAWDWWDYQPCSTTTPSYNYVLTRDCDICTYLPPTRRNIILLTKL